MRRVLIIAAYFLPRRRVGSMRPFRFAIHLRELGWAPTVLTIAAPGQKLTPKEERLLHDVNVIEISSPMDRTRKSESQLGGEKHGGGRSRRRLAGWIDRLERQVPVDTWMLLYAARYRRLIEVVQQLKPDVIMATGDPWSSLVIGGRLAERFGLPYVADFRDPWTLSAVRTADQWRIPRAVDRRFERRIVERASMVLFQSERVEEMYREHYRDVDFRSRTIPNSFDPVVFDDPIDLESATAHAVSPGDGLRIGFFGRFRRMSPARLIADALAEMGRMDAAAAEAVLVTSFGPLSSDDEEYAAEQGVLSRFTSAEPVPLERSLSTLREFDILLLSTEESRTHIIPAKLFEYLAAGRPILSLSRNTAVAEILKTTGSGVQLTDSREVAALLLACLHARRKGEPMPIAFDPNPDEIRRYEARQTTHDLATLFDEIVDGI